MPRFGAQNLDIHRLRNALVIKGDVAHQSLETADESEKVDGNFFSWWLLVVGEQIPGITVELRQKTLRIRIPTFAEHRQFKISTFGKNAIARLVVVFPSD